jgi:drug/metabolite transporter (DMT)-like permease
MSPRVSALVQALFVTFIWSASWVLIKIGLEGIPPVTFAGLRYMLAFLCLFVVVASSGPGRAQVARLSSSDWRGLVLLGVVLYALAQGAQFAALGLLPPTVLSLILNFTPIAVAVFGFAALRERPTLRQIAGIGVFLLGVLIYFADREIPAAQLGGIAIGIMCMVTNAVGSVLGRGINRAMTVSPIVVTVVSMGIGAILLLAFGLLTEGLPSLTPTHWAIIVWLATVHTALTFVMWNRALRHLTAVESSLINSLMLVLIAILAWVFLGEQISPQGAVGIGFATVGIVLVQVRFRRLRVAKAAAVPVGERKERVR